MEKITRNPDGTRIIHRYEPMRENERPQDPSGTGAELTFETLEHGGEYPDAMPQAIRITDPQGRSCIYFPATEDGKVVRSLGFELISDDRVELARKDAKRFPSIE
jgi:hypothetical protein